jgi:hypothetical protein
MSIDEMKKNVNRIFITCLELRGGGGEIGWGRGAGWRNDPNNVCTCE